MVAGFPADPNAAFTFAESQIRNYYDGFDGSTQLSLTTFPQYLGRVRRAESRVLGSTGAGTGLHTTFTYDAYGRTTQTQGNNYCPLPQSRNQDKVENLANFLTLKTKWHV